MADPPEALGQGYRFLEEGGIAMEFALDSRERIESMLELELLLLPSCSTLEAAAAALATRYCCQCALLLQSAGVQKQRESIGCWSRVGNAPEDLAI